MIVEFLFSLWTEFLEFSRKKFMKDVNTAFSAPRWSTSAKTFFSWNKLNISIYFRTLKQKNVDIQRKPIYQNCQNCLERIQQHSSRAENLFGRVTILNFCLELSEGHSNVGPNIFLWCLQTAVYESNGRIRTKWLSLGPLTFMFLHRLWAKNIQCCQNLILLDQRNLWRLRF